MCEFDKNHGHIYWGERDLALDEDSSDPTGPKQHPVFMLEGHPHFPEWTGLSLRWEWMYFTFP